MSVEIRALSSDELPQLMDQLSYAFVNNSRLAERGPDDDPPILPEWSTCAIVDGRLATSFAAFPFRVRLNGRSTAMAGITMVSTNPEFRRRGLLRSVMTQALAEERDRGQAIAILWASMGAIYQRFGFGSATTHVSYDADRTQLAFNSGERSPGRVQLMPLAEARPILQAVYKEFATPRNLLIQRAGGMWDVRLRETPGHRNYFGVYFDEADVPSGYVQFQLTTEQVDRGPDQVLTVSDLIGLDAQAYRGIWEFLTAHDLVYRVRWDRVPEDDAAPLLLQEPRQLGRRTRDGVWMRVTDVESALAQRRYGDSGVLTLAVRDELCPWNSGVFAIDAGGDEAAVTRATSSTDADLTVDAASLAVLLSGHRSATQLARAGLIDATGPAALRIADRLFATDYAPWCADGF